MRSGPLFNPEAPLEGLHDHWQEQPAPRLKWWWWLLVGLICGLAYVLLLESSRARDGDNHGNHGNLKQWFDQLASGKGLCCSFADGFSVQDVDWDTKQGRYRVRLKGEWVAVPDEAIVSEPNRFGPAVVWPYQDAAGTTQIRCFMPGAGT